MNVIVMGGLGKVGQAIGEAMRRAAVAVQILDKKDDLKPVLGRKYEFLHVAIPWTKDFHRDVRHAIQLYKPVYTVVHSTVPVGTTRRLMTKAAHSPVRGQHDNLERGIFKFEKYVGGVTPKVTMQTVYHLKACGISAEGWSSPEETELNKLLCLTRYLNDLAMYEVAFKLCKRFKVPPARFVQWTRTYNEGYSGTGFQRPMLLFPMGYVGGTCAMPVPKMLAAQTKDPWIMKNIELFEGGRGVA